MESMISVMDNLLVYEEKGEADQWFYRSEQGQEVIECNYNPFNLRSSSTTSTTTPSTVATNTPSTVATTTSTTCTTTTPPPSTVGTTTPPPTTLAKPVPDQDYNDDDYEEKEYVNEPKKDVEVGAGEFIEDNSQNDIQ